MIEVAAVQPTQLSFGRFGRLVIWAALALAAAWLVFDAGGWLGIYSSTVRIVNLALAAILLGTWVAVAVRHAAWRPRSALLPALLLCLASLAVSTLASRSPRVSLEYLGYAVVLVSLYLLLVRLMANSFFRPRMVAVGGLLFFVFSADFLVRAFLLWTDWWRAIGHVSVPPLRPEFIGLSYGNPSAVLTVVALLALPAAFLVRPRWRLAGGALIVGIVALVALISGSRAGWLALAVAAVASLGVIACSAAGRKAVGDFVGRVRGGERRQLVLAGAGAVGIGLLTLVLLPAIFNRAGSGGEDLRATFWAVALRLFAQAPILGTGPGTWVIQRVGATQANEVDFYIPHAHDVPLQTLAELGVVGAVAGAILIAAVAGLLWTAWRRGDGTRRWFAWVTFAGLVYLSVHDLLDFYPNFPAVLFAVALPIAYFDATTDPDDLPTWMRAGAGIRNVLNCRALIVAAAALVVVTFVGLVLQEGPAQNDERAASAADVGDWAAALAPAVAAADADPDVHAYAMTAGLAAAHAGDLAGAARYFTTVAHADGLPEAWLDLASVQADRGLAADAKASLAAALRLGIQRAPVAMAAGDLYLRLGSESEALTAFAAAVALRPSLAGDAWWHADGARDRLYPAIVERAIATADDDLKWEIALMSGDPARAATLALTSGRPDLDRTVIAAWGGDSTATAMLDAGCRDNPLDVTRVVWCARIANRDGSPAEADRYRVILIGTELGAPELSAELRVLTSSPVAWITNQTAAYWGLYTYRRQIPKDILVPGLVHLELR